MLKDGGSSLKVKGSTETARVREMEKEPREAPRAGWGERPCSPSDYCVPGISL